MIPTDNAGVPVCAEHPGRAAIGTCERCGGFFCPVCASSGDAKSAGGTPRFCKHCDTRRSYIAWEDPKLGVVERYFETLRNSVSELPKLAAELPLRGGYAAPLAFALVPTAIMTVIFAGVAALFVGTMMHAPGLAKSMHGAPPGFGAAAVFTLYLVLGLGSFLAYLVVWSGVLTLSARMFGARHLHHEGMFRILCYASGMNALYIVPVLGMGVLIYHVIVSVFAIAAQGQVSALKALAIYAVPVVLLGSCCCGSYVLLLFSVMRPH